MPVKPIRAGGRHTKPHQTWYSGSGARAAEFSKAEFSKAGMGGTYRWPGGVLGARLLLLLMPMAAAGAGGMGGGGMGGGDTGGGDTGGGGLSFLGGIASRSCSCS